MTAVVLSPEPERAWSGVDRAPLLRWLIFTGATVFAAIPVVALRPHSLDGCFRPHVPVLGDRSDLRGSVAALCLANDRRFARRRCGTAGRGAHRDGRRGRPHTRPVGGAPRWSYRRPHPRSCLESANARAWRLDQTLLLRSLADRLRGSNGFGSFASDTLMKLGLLGTIIGFIIMLAPIAGLDVSDKSVLKSSMGLMSEGMAVAMYTTLAGLVGSILLKVQYYMLESATAKVFSRAVTLTETRVVPALERSPRSGHTRMIDDFGLYPREEPFDPFSVMLFKALQVVAFLFFLALLAISPEAKDGKINSKAEFIITMDWPDSHPDDLDLFVQDPVGNIAWYRHREAGFLVLDRDDRGGANDFIVVNARKIASPIREEIVTIRGLVAGEYTVNVSHFVATTSAPVPAKVKGAKA